MLQEHGGDFNKAILNLLSLSVGTSGGSGGGGGSSGDHGATAT